MAEVRICTHNIFLFLVNLAKFNSMMGITLGGKGPFLIIGYTKFSVEKWENHKFTYTTISQIFVCFFSCCPFVKLKCVDWNITNQTLGINLVFLMVIYPENTKYESRQAEDDHENQQTNCVSFGFLCLTIYSPTHTLMKFGFNFKNHSARLHGYSVKPRIKQPIED